MIKRPLFSENFHKRNQFQKSMGKSVETKQKRKEKSSFIVLRALARFIHKILLPQTKIFIKVNSQRNTEIIIEPHGRNNKKYTSRQHTRVN